MKRASIHLFEKLDAQLESIYQEISALARKAPNDAVNAFKIGLVNSTLRQCNDLFGKDYLPFADFTEFPQDELPTNSDVAFVVLQYRDARRNCVPITSGLSHSINGYGK